MHIDCHWLTAGAAVCKPSENFDDRPDEQDISLIVIHCISLPPGEFGTPYIDHLFANRLQPEAHDYFQEIYQMRVSAHVLIRRSGDITQYVAFNKRAWHAGQSQYQGRDRCNDFSIGIELEGTETKAYTDEQYRQLARLIKSLWRHYPSLSQEAITGHCDIAPDRKSDPGESFDWQRLRQLISS